MAKPKKKATRKRAPKKSPQEKLREQLEAEILDLLIQLQAVPAEGHRTVTEHIATLRLQHRLWVVRETLAQLLGKFSDAIDAQRASKGVSECLVRAVKASIADRLDDLEDEVERQRDNASALAGIH